MKLIVFTVSLIAAITVDSRNLHGPQRQEQASPQTIPPLIFDRNLHGPRQESPSPTLPPTLIFDSKHSKPVHEAAMEVFEQSNQSPVNADGLYQLDDMLLTENQWEALRMRKAIKFENYRWTEDTNGYPLVPYFSLGFVNKEFVERAVGHWTEHTCIKFEEDTNPNQPHLVFQIHPDKDGVDGNTVCRSSLGMQGPNGGPNAQPVYVGNQCSLGTAIHEIGHAMGFFHEQSRPDRDDYVTILDDNIRTQFKPDFISYPQYIDNDEVPYDYSSIMHYGATGFTIKGKPTIVTKKPSDLALIGQRVGLSHRDKLLANKMYNCIKKWLTKCVMTSDPCLNDGYTGQDCICICPPGTTGSICGEVTGDYYDEARNERTEEISTTKRVSVETTMQTGTSFLKSIVPPMCKLAKVSFVSSNMFSDCKYQSLVVVTDPSDVIGQTFCAADIKGRPILTSETGILITTVNSVTYRSDRTLWEADVSFEDIPDCTDPSLSTTTAIIAPDLELCSGIFEIIYEWPQHVYANLTITFPNTVSSWNLELTFNNDITDFTIWNQDADITTPRTVNIIPKFWNANQVAGKILPVGFIIVFDGSSPSLISAKLNGNNLCN